MTTRQAPAPFVPKGVDLRDFQFMPLYGDILFDSETWLLCSFEEKVAALSLWWKAWHQLPAGSLPSDDRLLSALAGYGVAIQAWKAVRDNAMRGWVLCSDGRFYHRFLAARVAEGWFGKVLKTWSRECDRVRKENKKRAEKNQAALGIPERPDIKSLGFPAEIMALVSGTDGEFQKKAPTDPPEPAPAADGIPAEKALKGQGQGQGQGESITPHSPPEGGGRVPRRMRRAEADPGPINTPEERDRNLWSQRLKQWLSTGYWGALWGPRHGEEGFQGPRDFAAMSADELRASLLGDEEAA